MTLLSLSGQRFVGIITLLTGMVAALEARGATVEPPKPKDRAAEFDYPELMVTPLASERLRLEARQEAADAWSQQLPLQASAALTTLAGLVAMNDPGSAKKSANNDSKPTVQYAGLASVIVGGGWLGTSVFLASQYRPYTSGLPRTKVAGAGKRDALTRERLAEEALLAPARLSTKIKWTAFASNLILSGMIAGSAGNDSTKLLGGMAAAAAVLPLMFPTRWEEVGDRHEDYKKKVYGPVADAGLRLDPETKRLGPTVTLTMNF